MSKSYPIKVVYCTLLGLTFAASSCGVQRLQLAKQTRQATVRPAVTYSKTALNSHPAKVTHTEATPTALEITKIKLGERLVSGDFFDEKNGWVAGRTSLFRTNDGGRSWKKLNLKIPSDATISSVFFINDTLGWVSLVKAFDVMPFGQSYSSSLLLTRDGGVTWTQKAEYSDGVEIGCLKFLSEGEGIATGQRLVRSKPDYPELFVTRTTNGGETWTDLSQRVNAAIFDEYGKANDFGAAVSWESPGRILLLSPLGRVVSSSDHGDTWQTLTQLSGGYEYKTSYRKLHVSKQGAIRVIGGSTVDEGAWGDLTLEVAANTWRSYELSRVPIFDAVSASENELVVCGGDARAPGAKGALNRLGPFTGIILHSQDAGQTWSVIYKSSVSENFVSLTKAGEHRYYALSDAGTLVKFSLDL